MLGAWVDMYAAQGGEKQRLLLVADKATYLLIMLLLELIHNKKPSTKAPQNAMDRQADYLLCMRFQN